MPQAYEINNLSDLLTIRHFPNDPQIDLKRANLEKAIKQYCLILKEQGIVQRCSKDEQLPEPTPKSLTMYNCPVKFPQFWKDYLYYSTGCFGQLSATDDCQIFNFEKIRNFKFQDLYA